MFSLALSVAITAVSIAFGRKLLSLFHVPASCPLERSLLGMALGFGVLGYAVLGVGLAGVLHPWSILLLLCGMLLFSLRELGKIFGEAFAWVRAAAADRLASSPSLILFALVCLGVMALIRALSPPSGMDWDGLAYHLAVPKIYLAEHRILYVPFISHSNFPFLTEMLYTIGLALDGAILAKLFHFWIYVALGVTVYAMCRVHFNPRTGSVAALILMSVPVVFWEAGVAYVDLCTALYVALAVYAVLNWDSDKSNRWLAFAGVMGGFALGTKVVSAVPIALLALWIVLAGGSGIGWSKRLARGTLMGVIALVVAAPWYIKSYVYTGNPVYPFMYDVFGGRYWSEAAALAYRESQLAFGHGRSFADLLLVPWALTMDGFRFYDFASLAGLIGPAFLGLLPVYVLAARPSRHTLLLGLLSLASLVAWFFLMQQSRYLISALPLLAVICAAGVTAANERWRFGRHVVNAYVGLCVLLTLFVGVLMSNGPARVVFGTVSVEDYLYATLVPYDAQRYANGSLPRQAKVVLFDEVLGFYLDRKYIWGNPGHHEMIPWESFKSGADMVGYFLKSGYSHALINYVNWSQAGDDALHGILIPDAIGRGLMVEVYASKGASLYEFSEKP